MKLSNILNDRTSHFVLIHTWILSLVFYLSTFFKLTLGPLESLSNICLSACLFAPLLILILAPNWKQAIRQQAIRQVFLATLALPAGTVLILIAVNFLGFFWKRDFGNLIKQTQATAGVAWLMMQMFFFFLAPLLLLAASSKWAFQKIKRSNSK